VAGSWWCYRNILTEATGAKFVNGAVGTGWCAQRLSVNGPIQASKLLIVAAWLHGANPNYR